MAFGASATTAGAVATTTAGLVEAGQLTLVVAGALELSKSTAEVATGQEFSGGELDDDVRSERLGADLVGWAALGFAKSFDRLLSGGRSPELSPSPKTAPVEAKLSPAKTTPSPPPSPNEVASGPRTLTTPPEVAPATPRPLREAGPANRGVGPVATARPPSGDPLGTPGSADPGAGSTTTSRRLYRIGEGVRRSVAARESSHTDILAKVAGQPDPVRVPLSDLLSPKASIPRDPRFLNILRGVMTRDPTVPPIEVSPVSPGGGQGLTPLNNVRLTRWRAD